MTNKLWEIGDLRSWLRKPKSMQKSAVIIASALWLSSANSSVLGQYFTYFQWEALDSNSKTLYISGLYDAYLGLSFSYYKTASFYNSCVLRLHINNAQLARGVERFAESKPSVQAEPIAGIMIQYLLQVCGKPPDDTSK